jgi:hypothetical protein
MADSPINSTTNYEVVTDSNGVTLRRSIAHLPSFYRTDNNHRFLTSTLDQLIQPGKLTRLDGYVGRQYSYTRQASDSYIEATSEDRANYQLEPAVTYTDKDTSSINPEDQVKFTATYDDYINQIKFFGGNTDNHDRLNKETVYAWNPAVDFDKLINYREYYWLPEGANPILVANNGTNSVTEIKVDHAGNGAYTFSTHSGLQNPSITLYRGNTYKFVLDVAGHPFYIMTEPFTTGIAEDGSTSVIYSSAVTGNGTEVGTLTFTVPSDAPDILYYQCGNHQVMQGIFTIKTITAATKIDVDHEIVGAKNYTMSTGTKLSNGMKLKFVDNVTSATYKNKEFYVEGVGDHITLTDTARLITPESYSAETTELYDTVTYDSRPYAISFYRPETPDYITIKRDSLDNNAWSRYNRWFHKSVIEASDQVNGNITALLETARAKRPIIEFDSGIQLYDHGTEGLNSVALIDTVTTDVFSTVVNAAGYIVDGISLAHGMRVLFTADTDSLVKNRIYKVNFVTVGGNSVINLTQEADGIPQDGQTVYAELGANYQGKTFYYSESEVAWQQGQTKTALNQKPLFSLEDNNNIKFNDQTVYQNSSFAGAAVFEYKTSETSPVDTVLGLRVKYNTINNVGDITFTSDLGSESFSYKSGEKVVSKSFSTGHVHYITSRTENNPKTSWIKRLEASKQRVIRTFIVESNELRLFPIDVFANSVDLADLEVQVDVNHKSQNLDIDYILVNGTTNKYVKFSYDLTVGDIVKIQCHSAAKKVIGKGLYEIPENLAVNPFNEQLKDFTFGQILNHVHNINEKNVELIGNTPGDSNLRDLPDVRIKGGTIIQHSAPLPQAMFLLIDQNANAISAIEYCSLEYQKFKEGFQSNITIGKSYEGDPAVAVDEIIKSMHGDRGISFPFFYEDMIGYGEKVSTRTYTVQDNTETEYAVDSQFDLTVSSNRAIYVYLNNTQLLQGYDYTFSATDDSVNITAALSEGDIIKIKDYNDTTGSFVPPTPTKLGIYPRFKPEKILDNTYLEPTYVIVGHDGSKTVAYGDYRDDILLELERRIYNNCKIAYDSTLLPETEVRTSVFQQSDYTLNEIDNILSYDFYSWAGRNAVDYQKNDVYDDSNPFTFNYSSNKDSVNSEYLPGHWRGIYNYFYDTDRPHTHPWEMLGHSEKPTWWEDTYGPGPYSAGNELLWNDLAAGYDKGLEHANPRYVRPGLLNYLPVDENGQLRSPIAAGLIDNYEAAGVNKVWKFGDHSPAETAWRKSEQYPFAVMKLLALTRPAKFFGLFFDNSRLGLNVSGNVIDTDTEVAQNIRTANYHLETSTDVETGTITRYITGGYQPFVVNYLIKNGLDPAIFFYDKMKNLNVQLAYKLGGFSDKQNLRILTDSVSPGSTAGSQFIPDENYKILFRVSNPINTFEYSGVLVELNTATTGDGSTLEGGYKVIGYNTIKPYFKIFEPLKNGNSYSIEAGNARAVIYQDYADVEKIVTYGTVFKDVQSLVNFLTGYGKYLESQGFVFDRFSRELKETANWDMSAKEFLYWTRQGWAPGSAITLSPGAEGFYLTTKDSVIGRLKNLQGEYTVLDSSGRVLNSKSISTKRIGTTFEIVSKFPESGIYNITMNAVQKEHIILFDNITVFSDILLQLATGFRQQRVRLIGWKTGDWNGDYYSPGFVFDEAQVSAWTANTDYQIGDTVEYNAKFYTSKINHNAGSSFESDKWQKKANKPAAQLIPNFDYKISQFNDFYNLESNNFDEGQQRLAQHLTGYQSRSYLDNLFLNDVSQYKFYQGFIREKGTLNAIDKLVKAKFYGETIDLNIYPEWMIRVGEFGNTDNKKSVQISMPDDTFTSNIQSIEILDSVLDSLNWEKSVRVLTAELYNKPLEYSSQETFSLYDYSQEGTDKNTVEKFKTAGYPRLFDVEHTAFTSTDLLNLDVSAITKHDLVWVAKKDNHEWDVLRLTATGLKITAMRQINNATQLEVILTANHNFVAGDYFTILNSQYTQLNGVYKVYSTPSATSLIFDYKNSNRISATVSLTDQSTINTYGNIYKWVSVRIASMDNVNDRIPYNVYRDVDTTNFVNGDRIFADNVTGKWTIYEKTNPYETKLLSSPDTDENQEFGYRVVARNDGKTLVVSAPGQGQGYVHFFYRTENEPGVAFSPTSSYEMTDGDDDTSRLGQTISISTDENYIAAGAPYNNTLALDGSTRHENAGIIKVFAWNNTTKSYSLLNTVLPPTDDSTTLVDLNYGWACVIAEPSDASTVLTRPKFLFASAPGINNDAGVVYVHTLQKDVGDSTIAVWRQDSAIYSNESGSDKRFGHQISVNDNADIIAISSVAPGTAGQVEIFTKNSVNDDGSSIEDGSTKHVFTYRQTLKGTNADGSTLNTAFGETISMSKDGELLVISAPGVDRGEQTDAGAIYIYKWNADGSTNTYTLQQTIAAPESSTNMRFGSTVQINTAKNRIVIGAEKFGNHRNMRFDNGITTFDLGNTGIVDLNIGSGGVFTATKYDTAFVIDDKLITDSVNANDDFGRGIFIIDTAVFVGAPLDDVLTADGSTYRLNEGTVTVFDLKEPNSYAWKALSTETSLVNDKKVDSSFIFNSANNEITDYLDYYDPVKGRILGIADREINYKTEWDPAVYNIGTQDNTVNVKTAWGEEHVGEVWWDMSRVKWLWYEQYSLEYKTKNWGKIFPGSSIDVYEWIESTLLPSEWNQRADTDPGLAQRVSGKVLYPNNTVFTVKQKYNTTSDSFVNYYYFWVRNSVFLPPKDKSVTERKNTTAYVANLIENPLGSGIKYYAITGTNSLITFNVKNSLINNNTVLNVNYKNNDNDDTAHSVWKLIREGDKDDRPNTLLEKKWWDSLVGKDSSGNEVPDITLPINERYGNSVRPRQSWYVNRFAALKEIVDYSNSVLKTKELSNNISYTNLNSADPEPTAASGEWDRRVESYADLTYIDTRDISGTINALVASDEENSKGSWAIYNWNLTEWVRIKVQTYKTSTYYNLADWYAEGYDTNTVIDKQVNYQYETATLGLKNGEIVKVLRADTGGWKLFEQTTEGLINVATQNGTIQLSKSLYDYTINNTGFDADDTFDANFFDQEPTIETRNILKALRDDIFVGDLAVEYNNIFFIGLRKVLEEQLYVDWLNKSSFINVTNSLRPLDQRKTYRVGNENFVEDYINEVKPFHTKIREYKLGYTNTETQDGINTDFDLPAFYDGNSIRNVDVTADVSVMATYPYRFWRDNYKKYVDSITVTNGGSGYITAPTVTLVGGTTKSVGPFTVLGRSNSGSTSGQSGYFYPLYTAAADADLADSQAGGSGTSSLFTFDEYAGIEFYMPDTGQNTAITDRPTGYEVYTTADNTQATATAIIQNGSVTRIRLLTPGSNYTATPRVVLTGGGAGGVTPVDAARAYANLRNDFVRDITTTIKFDRVQSTATVLDWTANTAYAYNTLIRYEEGFYKVNSGFTSTEDFDDGLTHLTKLRGDEPYITAAERTLGLYAPEAGMPGNELSQVMTGVDYGGVMVTGLAFNSGQGWDRSPWYDNPWDTYGLSRVKTFYGDGSSTAFTFASAPKATDVYTVYINGVRQTSLVFRGDGSTKTFTVIPDDSSVVGNGDEVQFIPFDDDGVLTPTDDKTLDSLISGGLFGSAVGIAPSDIILEGDGFVTPETSYAPEENVPGSMFDTVDIKVYTTPESGVPFIVNKNYIGDGVTQTYNIGQYPGTDDSVMVTLDGQTMRQNDEYTVDPAAKTITFLVTPISGSKISIKSFAVSGSNYMVLNTFIGDGSTASFTTSARETFQLDSAASQLYVTVDGQPTTAYNYTVLGKLITITLHTGDGSTLLPPAAGKLIQISSFNQPAGSGRAYAEVRSEQLIHDGTNRYTLTYPAGAIGPYSGLTLVEVNGKILRGPDNTYYAGDGSTTSYSLGTDPANTVTVANEVEVYVNGSKKYQFTDYTVNIGTQQIQFVSAPSGTDVIAVSVLLDNHYYNEGSDVILKSAQLTADGISLSSGDIFVATTFNNAVGMNQRRETFAGVVSGEFYLEYTPLNSDYVFVWLNGESLTQGYNFLLNGNKITIGGLTLSPTDRIDVMYFAVVSATNATGFRIFKDMLNRTFFKRISADNTTTLAAALADDATAITVADGSVLASPPGGSVPAVIFIDKERIEYFIKSGSTLSQLRRGTLGTGIRTHAAGTQVVDASGSETVPYAETVYTKTSMGDGSTKMFPTTIAAATPYELDVFVGGRRLPYMSEDGSTVNYTVDGSTANVVLTSTPAADVQVKIVQKRGVVWYTPGAGTAADGKGLQKSTTNQAKFIAGEPTNVPE